MILTLCGHASARGACYARSAHKPPGDVLAADVALFPSPRVAITSTPSLAARARGVRHVVLQKDYTTAFQKLIELTRAQAKEAGRPGIQMDINHQDKNGKTPLYLAIEHKNGKMMDLLYGLGADGPDTLLVNSAGWTVLHSAVNTDDLDTLKKLISHFSAGRIKVLLQTQDRTGREPLHIAAYKWLACTSCPACPSDTILCAPVLHCPRPAHPSSPPSQRSVDRHCSRLCAIAAVSCQHGENGAVPRVPGRQQRQIGHQRKHSLQAGGPRGAAQVQGDHRRAPCSRNPDPDARLMLDPTQCRPLLQRRKNACVAQPHGISTTREHRNYTGRCDARSHRNSVAGSRVQESFAM